MAWIPNKSDVTIGLGVFTEAYTADHSGENMSPPDASMKRETGYNR